MNLTKEEFLEKCIMEDGICIIPRDVSIIPEQSFYRRDDIEEVLIPENIKFINKKAFASCINLKKVSFEDGVSLIDNEAFFGCTKLKEIFFPRTVNIIGSRAFKQSGLEIAFIPILCFYDECTTFERKTVVERYLPKIKTPFRRLRKKNK